MVPAPNADLPNSQDRNFSFTRSAELVNFAPRYKFLEMRGCKIEYEPSLAPNENFPLRNGTWAVFSPQSDYFGDGSVTDESTKDQPSNGVWSPWKPFKYYWNVAAKLAQHRADPILEFDYNQIGSVSLKNISAQCSAIFATSRVTVGPTASVASEEVLGKLKLTWYVKFSGNR